jgi:hypothetical protein
LVCAWVIVAVFIEFSVVSCVVALQYREDVVINELLVCDVPHHYHEYFL